MNQIRIINTTEQRIFLDISCSYVGDYNELTVYFRDNNQKQLDILSTSSGSVLDDRILIHQKPLSISVDIKCPNKSQRVECILTYFQNDEIVHCETSVASIPRSPRKNNKPIAPRQLRMDDTSLSVDDLVKKQGLTKWRIELTIDEDVVLSILSSSNLPTLMSFGEISTNLMHTDIIYTAYTDTKTIIIPKEIIYMNYDKYRTTQLGCCELVSISSQNFSNLYYKIPVSNVIEGNGLSKRDCKLSDFQYPTGGIFDPRSWQIGQFGLPEVF